MTTTYHDGTNIPTAPPKDPDSSVAYGFNYVDIVPTGAVITSSTWVLPADLSEVSKDFDDTSTVIVIGGGLVDNVYLVTNRITTNSTLLPTDDRSMHIRVREI